MPDTSTRNSLALPLSTDGGQTFYVGLHTNFERIDLAISRCNWAATTDPAVTDDISPADVATLGPYSVGSLWWNVTAHRLWVCEDNANGAAVWEQVWPAKTVDLSGTITNAQLAGSIANDKLAGSIANDKLAGSITDDKLSSIYALLLGRAGGQTLEGDTASGGNLTLSSTHHATKGNIILGSSVYDEVNNRLGLRYSVPGSIIYIPPPEIGIVDHCITIGAYYRLGHMYYGYGTYQSWNASLSTSDAAGNKFSPIYKDGWGMIEEGGYNGEKFWYGINWGSSSAEKTYPTDFTLIAKLTYPNVFTVSGVLKSTGASPKMQLEGTEGSAINVSLRENAGKVELYNETGAVVYRTLYPETVIVHARHLPVLAATGAAEALTTVWKEPVFFAPPSSSYVVTDAGVIPDALSTAFGAATDNFSLTLVNKGTDGAGTTAVSATKQFSSAATVMDAVSFGAISSPNVTAGQVLAVEKTITGNGLVCQGCTFYIVMTRIS
jgi:hypothetical protein